MCVPHFKIKPVGDVRKFLTDYALAGGPHHNAVCFGDARRRLKLAAEMMGADYCEICPETWPLKPETCSMDSKPLYFVWNYTDADRAFWVDHLENWLPRRIIDAHTHVMDPALRLVPMTDEMRRQYWANEVLEPIDAPTADRCHSLVFPDREVEARYTLLPVRRSARHQAGLRGIGDRPAPPDRGHLSRQRRPLDRVRSGSQSSVKETGALTRPPSSGSPCPTGPRS